MRYVPHEYQEYAKEFIISHKVSALFLDCGLGKTVITLTAIWELLFDYFDIRKILIIAPLRVCYLTWPSELEKWEHLSGMGMSAVLGSEKERIAALGRKAQVYVINRENVEWLVENHKWDFDMVVIDELSSFKSHKAKRFKALKKVRPMVRRIVGLTGTPAPNGLIDLWAEIGILDMGQRLGRFIGGYRERFFVPDKRSREMVFSYKPREGAEDMIYNLISDICISMKAVDYLDMEYKGDVTVKVDALAASAASVIAMAGTTVLMSPLAMMMIHNPITVAIGDSKEMQKAGEMLDEVKEGIMNAYEIKTGMDRKKISYLMDAESWFNAKKAVELGFADGILHGKEDTEERNGEKELEGLMFSRTAVTNSLLTKLIPKKPEAKVPIEQLEKRLQLLSH